MKRFNFYLSEDEMNLLKVVSKKSGLSVSEHLRRIIDRYLEERLSKDEIKKTIGRETIN